MKVVGEQINVDVKTVGRNINKLSYTLCLFPSSIGLLTGAGT